jgi:hypothetical protein
MSVSPETDPDGVDRPTESAEHENTRESTEGVEDVAVPGGEEQGKAATGLIGNGQMVDPRLIAPR